MLSLHFSVSSCCFFFFFPQSLTFLDRPSRRRTRYRAPSCVTLACLLVAFIPSPLPSPSLLNVRTFCSACSTKGDCDRSRAHPSVLCPPPPPPPPSLPTLPLFTIILTYTRGSPLLLCQACKAVITRHVVSVGQTATGAPSRSRLISAR